MLGRNKKIWNIKEQNRTKHKFQRRNSCRLQPNMIKASQIIIMDFHKPLKYKHDYKYELT